MKLTDLSLLCLPSALENKPFSAAKFKWNVYDGFKVENINWCCKQKKDLLLHLKISKLESKGVFYCKANSALLKSFDDPG